MVFTVRCYKCGEVAVRLIMGGRAILHARCQACHANLLDEVMTFEAEVAAQAGKQAAHADKPTQNGLRAVVADPNADPAQADDERTPLLDSPPKY